VAWICDFYLLVLKTILYSLAALVRKILFSPLEDKSHIFAPPCNILYLYSNIHSNILEHTFECKIYIIQILEITGRTLCYHRAWNNSRSMIGKKLLMIGGKAGFQTWKKQGKSWLPIAMIGNFGNVISSLLPKLRTEIGWKSFMFQGGKLVLFNTLPTDLKEECSFVKCWWKIEDIFNSWMQIHYYFLSCLFL
jgi:hypothetical protein